ncbi:MAG: hypothetical protein EOP82_04770 [Variovorax sp.]|nr:MAG: hypothetical protein EOP82_04770 [Variovorax sp.]
MKPLIDILRLGWDAYAYRISAHEAVELGADSTFDSLEGCLFDAGDSLGHYFPRVEVSLDGRHLGSCATELLRRNPKGVAERIAQRSLPA